MKIRQDETLANLQSLEGGEKPEVVWGEPLRDSGTSLNTEE